MDRHPNFGSVAKYKKYLAYGHATGVFKKTPGHQTVTINGRPRKVIHSEFG